MKRLENMIRTYYCRSLFTESSFRFGYCSLPFVLIFMLVMGDDEQGFNSNREINYLIYYWSLFSIGLLLICLNWIGRNKVRINTKFNWRWIPYLSALYATLTSWWISVHNLEFHFDVTPVSKLYLIYYPFIFPLVVWLVQYLLINIYTEREPRKDLLRLIPFYIYAIPTLIFIFLSLTSQTINLSGIGIEGYAFGSVITMFTWIIPFGFTGVSTYWHPELEQSRYGNALAGLKGAKKKLPKQKNQLQKTLKK